MLHCRVANPIPGGTMRDPESMLRHLASKIPTPYALPIGIICMLLGIGISIIGYLNLSTLGWENNALAILDLTMLVGGIVMIMTGFTFAIYELTEQRKDRERIIGKVIRLDRARQHTAPEDALSAAGDDPTDHRPSTIL